METSNKEDLRYRTAKKKVKKIKRFYVHLLVYFLVNAMLLVVTAYDDGTWKSLSVLCTYSTALFWGIGVFAHCVSVFGPNILLGQDWEDRKIRELMEKKQKNIWE